MKFIVVAVKMDSVEDVPRRKFDIIVFGASGFTGQYVVEELARTIDEENGVTWAVAGRCMKSLQKVLATASKETGNVPRLRLDFAIWQTTGMLNENK